MKKPLNKRYREFAIGCVASLLLLLTGCEDSGVGPVGPPGAMRGNSVGPARMPARQQSVTVAPGAHKAESPFISAAEGNPSDADKEKSADSSEERKDSGNPLAPAAPILQGGNTVNLASELIGATINPFLNRLPKAFQTEVAATSGSDQNTAPPADPLDAVKLMGIIYSAKSPIALISVSGATASSQLVRIGDLIDLSGGQAVVARITQDSMDVQLQGLKQERKTLSIPDIIGYDASKDAANSPMSSSSPLDDLQRDRNGMAMDSNLGSSGMGGVGVNAAALGNLSALVQQLTGASGQGGAITNSVGNPASSNPADIGSSGAVLRQP